MDSRPETRKHIEQVRRYLSRIIDDLADRWVRHDASKLTSPEVEIFDEFTPKLAGSTYGSDEYKGFLAGMKVGLDHHYAANDHHPEHERARSEEWRDVVGYEGLYQVNNFGDVRGLDRVAARAVRGDLPVAGKMLILQPTPKGYLRVQLSREAKPKNHLVHQLVALAFLPNPEGKPEVNHENGIKHDNRVGNLTWATPGENQEHAYDTGLRESAVKYVVTCVELDLTTFGCMKMEAALRERGHDNVLASGIWACVAGDNTSHAGFTFTSQNIAEYRASLIAGMNLAQLIELLCDWLAATKRHQSGDIRRSIEQNQQRFGYSDELKRILLNTLPLLDE